MSGTGTGPDAGLGGGGSEPEAVALTPRQREIARLIARGLPNAQIGAALRLDRWAVAEEIERLRDALGAQTRLQVAALALGDGDANRSAEDASA